MSGHSKWSTIKRKKGAADAKRGQLFTKLTREILIAARSGGADADMNFQLRLAVQKARDSNMPLANIERAIQRGGGTSGDSTERFEEVSYEGYASGGAAIFIEAVTDNLNRTVAEIRSTFSKSGGNLGEPGSVSWNFESKGIVVVETGDFEREINDLRSDIRDLQNTITEMKEQSETENSYGDEIIIVAIGLGIAGIAIGTASFAKKK